MPSTIDSIEKLKKLTGLWEVIGFGRVRHSTHFSQETEVEIFFARSDTATPHRFTAASEIVSQYVGCGHLDLVTVGSRWRGGFYEDQVDLKAPLEGHVSFVKNRTVGESLVPDDGAYFPTRPFKDAPAYLVRLGPFAEKRFAILPVLEVVRHVFGVSSGFLRQTFDGIRDEELLPNRPVVDRKSSHLDGDVFRLRSLTPMRNDEAAIAAAMLTDQRLLRAHDGVSNGLRTSAQWIAGLPAFVQTPFPFAHDLKWRFYGRWICVSAPTKPDGVAWRFLITQILDIDYDPGIRHVVLDAPRRQPNPLTRESRRQRRKGRARAATVQIERTAGKAWAPSIVVSPKPSFLLPGLIKVDRSPPDGPAALQAPPVIVDRLPRGTGSTADPQPGGDEDVTPLEVVRARNAREQDPAWVASVEKTYNAINAVARRRAWTVTGPHGDPVVDMYCCPITANGVERFLSLAVGVQTEHGHVLLMDAGTTPQARHSLGIIVQDDCAPPDTNDFRAIKAFGARCKGHWGGTPAARPEGMSIVAYDRPPHAWENTDFYSMLIGGWIEASIGGAARLF